MTESPTPEAVQRERAALIARTTRAMAISGAALTDASVAARLAADFPGFVLDAEDVPWRSTLDTAIPVQGTVAAVEPVDTAATEAAAGNNEAPADDAEALVEARRRLETAAAELRIAVEVAQADLRTAKGSFGTALAAWGRGTPRITPLSAAQAFMRSEQQARADAARARGPVAPGLSALDLSRARRGVGDGSDFVRKGFINGAGGPLPPGSRRGGR